MMNRRVLMALAAILLAGNVSMSEAQAPAQKPAAQQPLAQAAKPPAQPQPPASRPQPPRQAASSAARAAIVLIVTDMVGKTLPDVRVDLNGPVSRGGMTSRDGALTLDGLRPGTYRLRFEAAGFITLERDVIVKAGPAAEVDVALDPAPMKPVEPPPPPPQNCRTAVLPDQNAAAAILELPDWIQRNLIGRTEPQKEASVGRTPVLTPSVIQVRDPTRERGSSDADEILYVIAGEGVLRAAGRDQALDAGSLAVIPRGVVYTLERRGRNPLIALSVVGK
jgi:mannose-6-phosphate isomerase-like protein (cupin superfamily)